MLPTKVRASGVGWREIILEITFQLVLQFYMDKRSIIRIINPQVKGLVCKSGPMDIFSIKVNQKK